MDEIQWSDCLIRLIEETRAAIREFARNHPDDEICHFAYDSQPGYGQVLTSFNTTRADREFVRLQHNSQVALRQEYLAEEAFGSVAYHYVKVCQVFPFCNNSGDFSHGCFSEIKFPEWQQFAMSADYPERLGIDDDYLESGAARIFALALDALADDGSFNVLRLAHPTLLGFSFHDDDHYVVRIINLLGGRFDSA